ncbi:MAG: ABC transporter ATP-binding protein, partial [Planctomycetes bacterium]|nr:ABC transporter ATP-binding protein [Planctomycetota bacterium]
MSEASELLVAERLVVGRGAPLLGPVDLRVCAGESWFVVGPNGSGKTTLLHTLVGLLRPLGGELRLGECVRDRRHLGFVPQEPAAAAALPCSVQEFVALGCHTPPGAATRDAVSAGLEAMGVTAL